MVQLEQPMTRTARAAIAKQTLAILEQGMYTTDDGAIVQIAAQVVACNVATRGYDPQQLAAMHLSVLRGGSAFAQTVIELHNETTLAGALRLYTLATYQRIGVLNFASAKNPGGGFLNGSQAQEESLARSSALYASLTQCPGYYAYHRRNRDACYSDHMIYSPACPIFRTDDGALLSQPYTVDFITSAAPNAGALRGYRAQLELIFKARMGKMLALAVNNRCDALVLGAWGCGVFRNEPAMVARLFGEYLLPGQPFHGYFKRVLFAVLDPSPGLETFKAFSTQLMDVGQM
ncbi:MAG: TIGR02452 family protein [Caldilineaceae bacterium]